jgi:hypothetical protein
MLCTKDNEVDRVTGCYGIEFIRIPSSEMG